MEGCCGSTVKYSGAILNFLMAIFGLLSFGLGIFLLFVYLDGQALTDWSLLFNGNLWVSPIGLRSMVTAFSVAGLLIIFAGLGCCSVITENKCVSYTTVILSFIFTAIVIVFAISIIIGTPFLVRSGLKDSLMEYSPKEINEATVEYPQAEFPVSKYSNSSSESEVDVNSEASEQQLTNLWDKLQIENNCCGVESYSDWLTSPAYPDKSGNLVPNSCCSATEDVETCLKDPGSSTSNNSFSSGCAEVVISKLKPINLAIISLAVLMVVYLLVLCMFGQCLRSSKKIAAAQGYETIENGD